MRDYLFGYLIDDFFGRVLVAPSEQTVGRLAGQLRAWGSTPARPVAVTVTNEAGALLDPILTIAAAGLGNDDIFTVVREA